jgi:FAD/FMN-containing dehydrogenase
MMGVTTDNREIELSQSTIDALKTRLRGPLLLPDESGYDDSRTVWNAMIDRRPALVARCLGTADVAACVQFAREHGLLLCIKGGGHNIAGLATADGALMLDLSLMRGVWVEPQEQIAHAQGGCLLGDVDRETQLHGLAAVMGFISQTGIAGLTLGGGFGYLTRRYGWTCDTVLGMNLVTADGRLVRASSEENPDLFWGLRLYPVGPEIVGGLVAWPASEAPGVLELFRTLTEQAPPELTLVVLMRMAPPAPWLPPEIHGKPIIAISGCYTGNPKEGEKVVASIKSYGKPVGDMLVPRPYVQMQSLLDATQPKGRRYYWKSEYLRTIDEAVTAQAIEHAARIVSPHSAILIFPLGGAVNELPEDHSAVGNRDAAAVLNISAAWDNAANDAENVEWARESWRDMRRFSTGGTYVNFLTEEEGDDRTRAAYRTNYPRLARLKAEWDPGNLFHTNKNIR